jgi:hypothetical protein
MRDGFSTSIESRDLKLTDVPGVDAEWSDIVRFALTWDFTKRYPRYRPEEQGWELVGELWSIDSLRARLFFEQRRWNHFGRLPDERTLAEIRRLVGLIRRKVELERPEP